MDQACFQLIRFPIPFTYDLQPAYDIVPFCFSSLFHLPFAFYLMCFLAWRSVKSRINVVAAMVKDKGVLHTYPLCDKMNRVFLFLFSFHSCSSRPGLLCFSSDYSIY